MRKKVMDLISKKIEETDMQKERERLRFKEKDLRRMAENLIQVSFGETDNGK